MERRGGEGEESYTIPEYLLVVEDAQAKYEYQAGKMRDMAGGSPNHALITMNLGGELRAGLKAKGKPCRVYSSDLMLHAFEEDAVLFPDITVVCGNPLTSYAVSMALTNPTLIVEVASPSTKDWDKGEKFEIYKSFESFREYLLVSQDRKQIEQYIKDDSGFWRRNLLDGEGDYLEIFSLGIQIDWDAIYEGVNTGIGFRSSF